MQHHNVSEHVFEQVVGLMAERMSEYMAERVLTEAGLKSATHVRARASLVRGHMSEVHPRRYARTRVRLHSKNVRTRQQGCQSAFQHISPTS